MAYDYYDDIEETEEEVIVFGDQHQKQPKQNNIISLIKKWFTKFKKIISILKE